MIGSFFPQMLQCLKRQLILKKTNISISVLLELDLNNSISAATISTKNTVYTIKQASYFCRPLFNAMVAYTNNIMKI